MSRAPQRPAPYRALADYALVGNTHSAALIASDGAIDWCCLPHFDSGAVFCRLLDARQGGYCALTPTAPFETRRRYRDSTAVLETEWRTAEGLVRVTDFMHSQRIARSRLGVDEPQCHRLLRCVEALSGCVPLQLSFRPTFDFARRTARLEQTPAGVQAVSGDEQLLLQLAPQVTMRIAQDRAEADIALPAGTRCWISIAHAPADVALDEIATRDPQALLDETERHWREWSALCSYRGRYRDAVLGSARVLKLLTFAPSGALVAAPTTSLPEEIGGARNWDYRCCWLRDSALILDALMALGYHSAAMDFLHWLGELGRHDGERLQIMYTLDGGRELPEQTLDHLAGYRDSRPVRIGNGAAGQTQLDVYGHVLDAAWVCLDRVERPVPEGLRRVLARLADHAAAEWRDPDHGVWEIRGPKRHYLSSKLLCWVALDRALRLVKAGKLEADDPQRWRRERDAARREILERGFNPRVGAFTQTLGGEALDASALLIPLVEFLPADDPRMRATLDSIRRQLTREGLVRRYAGDDHLAGSEGSFAICTFWLVDNLTLQGRVEEARALFERMLRHGSDLGLFGEEIDAASGSLLGNYPQGYTHLALIKSALLLERAVQQ